MHKVPLCLSRNYHSSRGDRHENYIFNKTHEFKNRESQSTVVAQGGSKILKNGPEEDPDQQQHVHGQSRGRGGLVAQQPQGRGGSKQRNLRQTGHLTSLTHAGHGDAGATLTVGLRKDIFLLVLQCLYL